MKIALLGAGNMGKAILEGLIRSTEAISGEAGDLSLVAYDNSPDRCDALPEKVDVLPPTKWFSGERVPDAIIIAVKPADISAACIEVTTCMTNSSKSRPLFISIAAGVSIPFLQQCTAPQYRICRVMPNICVKVGEGMSACSLSDNCTDTDRAIVQSIFTSCGRVVFVPEKLLHAVTGLSGSGPAYAFLFIEALIEGGIGAGLPMDVARECAVQTVLGAAKMVQQSTDHTGALKAAVMSPGGTTAAGLRALERGAFKYTVTDAVSTATQRSVELGEHTP